MHRYTLASLGFPMVLLVARIAGRPIQSATRCVRRDYRRKSKGIPFWHVEESKCGPCGMRHRIVIITTRWELIAMRMNPRSAETAAPGAIWERPVRIGAKRIDQWPRGTPKTGHEGHFKTGQRK